MVGRLSVVIPTFCDAPYLAQCLDSLPPYFHLIREVCVSDNASTDQTWDVVDAYRPPGIAVRKVLQKTHVPAHENWERALALSTGTYVLFLSSDDYLLPAGLDEAIEMLDAHPTLSGVALRMRYFVDGTDEVLIELPPPDVEQDLNGQVDVAVNWMLSHANHDELVYSVWRRTVVEAAMCATNPTSREAVAWWWVLNAILASPGRTRIGVTTAVVLMKRVEKKHPGGSPASGHAVRYGRLGRSLNSAKVSLRGRYGSMENLLRMHRRGLIDRQSFRSLLFQNRVNASTGVTFGGPLSPFGIAPNRRTSTPR